MSCVSICREKVWSCDDNVKKDTFMYKIFGIVKLIVYICDMIFMISRFTKSSLEVGSILHQPLFC